MTITNNFVVAFLIVIALGLASTNGGISVKNLIAQSASTEQSTNRTTSPSQRESAVNGTDVRCFSWNPIYNPSLLSDNRLPAKKVPLLPLVNICN
jgi:hypothetical protein